jgi:hypothetical protein
VKFRGNPELQSKVEEVENIIESYTNETQESYEGKSELDSGTAFSMTIEGSQKFSGTYIITADYEKGAVAFLDDLGYLRIEILGTVDGKEAIVSFFVENSGTGRQEWSTDGHFVFELMNQDGDPLLSLWGSEEMGYFDIIKIDEPGGFVTGKINGRCLDGTGDQEEFIQMKAEFRVRYVEYTY